MTSPAKLNPAAAGSATDLFIVSQGCVGTPPTATGGTTLAMTGAQLRAWAQSGLSGGALANGGYFTSTVQNVDLHTALGDVAHFVLPGCSAFACQFSMIWNASALTGSVTWEMWSGPNRTGVQLANSATATTFGGASGTAYTQIAMTANWVSGHDAYLNVTALNAVALTANVSFIYRQLL